MKRKIILTIALVLSIVAVSLITSDATATAAPPQRFVADTGLIIPGPHQKLRLSVTGDYDGNGQVDGVDYVVMRRMEYAQGPCTSDGVCKLTLASQSATDQIRLRAGEAATLEIVDGTSNTMMGLRGIVTSNHRDVRVTLQLIDTHTGQTESMLMALLGGLPGVN